MWYRHLLQYETLPTLVGEGFGRRIFWQTKNQRLSGLSGLKHKEKISRNIIHLLKCRLHLVKASGKKEKNIERCENYYEISFRLHFMKELFILKKFVGIIKKYGYGWDFGKTSSCQIKTVDCMLNIPCSKCRYYYEIYFRLDFLKTSSKI